MYAHRHSQFCVLHQLLTLPLVDVRLAEDNEDLFIREGKKERFPFYDLPLDEAGRIRGCCMSKQRPRLSY